MKSLVGISPHIALPHGPSKIYVDAFLWHRPDVGVVASYTPKAKDTHDHFGIYRGADQIESFGQASVVAGNAFKSCIKKNMTFQELYEHYNFVFMTIGNAVCKSFIKLGDTAIVHAHFVDYKFRQMTSSGKIYKVSSNFNLESFYEDYSESDFLQHHVHKDFVEVTTFENLIGKGIKNKLI